MQFAIICPPLLSLQVKEKNLTFGFSLLAVNMSIIS